MNQTLKKIKDVRSPLCISVLLNTHRTRPDNQQDPIVLKNLLKEAEERLLAETDKRTAQELVVRLKELEKSIDHNFNLESLALFVNDSISEYTRLPISVENRVQIDQTFATRDLVRAMHREANYYVLVLSQQKVRLIEMFNDTVVSEVGKPFPIENKDLYSTNSEELSDAARQTRLVAEFFNRVDKALNAVRKEHPLPVLICSEEGNYNQYLSVADEKSSIYEQFLNGNRLDATDHSIATEAWQIVQAITGQRILGRKAELEKSVSSGKFFSDINDIWRATQEGRIQTLFIEEGLFASGYISEDGIALSESIEKEMANVIDDVYDEVIEAVMRFGGDVVFLPSGELKNFNGCGAISRY
jgi:hypothetical protein